MGQFISNLETEVRSTAGRLEVLRAELAHAYTMRARRSV